MPRALRSVAIALRVRPASMQRSRCGRKAQACSAALRPVDLGLAWIAELDAARLRGGKGMARALADRMSRVLGGSGEHVKRQTIRAWNIGNGEIEAP
jgi:hypothetical protein